MVQNKKLRPRFWLSLAPLVLCAAIALSLMLGGIVLSPARLWEILVQGAGGTAGKIFWFSRLPRTAACVLAGAALALSGTVLQNVLANPMASPGIIGVNAGAGLGVTLCCALGALSGWWVSLSAFLGSLLAVLTIACLSRYMGASKSTVILSGIVMNSLCGAMTDTLSVLDPDVGLLSMEYRVGGFSAVSYPRLVPASLLILGAMTVLFTLTNELDVIALGDETAQGVGLPVRQYRLLFLLLAALLAGAAVSFAGLLGFIGLIVPHFLRRLVGSESRFLLPAAACYGGAFVALCDLLARQLFYPYELPVGILMSLIGAPVFLTILLRYKRRHVHG